MSGSTGQILGTVVGAVVGYFVPVVGWAAGAAIGGAVGGAIDPPKGPKIEGPRLNDLSVQTATYGAVIPRVYGTVALMGNIFWLENNQLQERSKTESQGGKGGGGGAESTTYSYYATFAVGLCEGPIAGVRRIWVGSKLIYDAGSDDISTIIASNESAGLFTIHTGSDTQLPDDRMQATLGVANTPAYRGLAYVVFKDYPLVDHGNSLLGAQVKVEVCSNYSAAIPRKIGQIIVGGFPANYRPRPIVKTEDGLLSIYAYDTGGGFNLIDGDYFPKKESIFIASYPDGLKGLSKDGTIDIIRPMYFSSGMSSARIGYLDKKNIWIAEWLSTSPIGGSKALMPIGSLINKNTFSLYGSYGDLTAHLPPSEISRYIFGASCSEDGNRIIVFTGNSVGSYVSTRYFVLNAEFEMVNSGDVSLLTSGIFNYGNVSLGTGGGTSLANNGLKGWSCQKYSGGFSVYYFYIDLSGNLLVSLVSTETFSGSGYVATMLSDGVFYVFGDSVNGARLYSYTDNISVNPEKIDLSEIILSECVASSIISASDIDVTGLMQMVRGYRVSSVAAIRSGIEPLQGAWPFDVLQSGYKIKFKPRGSAVVSTVPAIDLDAHEFSKAGGVSITATREMDSILPARVVLKHIDINREYDQGEQYAERLNTSAVNISTVEMPIVMTATEAAANAEMLLYLYWLERHDISFSLPPTYSRLEPGDVLTVNADSATYELRLTAINYLPDGRLECSAKYNSAAVYSPTAIGEEGQSTGAVLTLTGSAAYELLDIPLLLDATDLPGFPVAMTGYLTGWPGGTVFRSDDAGQTWANLQTFVAPGAAMGSAGTALGSGRLGMFDAAGVLSVSLISGALSSVTEAALLNGANHFAYGAHGRWEIIAAKNCTLQGDGNYILTDLLRGRFGSEHACASHVSGDSVVLLDSNKLAFVTANLNTIGAIRTYRGITAGKAMSTDSDKAFTYTGVNLECLAPVYLNGNRHPTTNDWSLDWIRRTRIGGEWRDYVDATLGETTQAYEVEIYSSVAYTTLKRTITGLATPAASYTSAQQVTDFGSNQTTLYVKVYQLSANVGRGYPLTTSITR